MDEFDFRQLFFSWPNFAQIINRESLRLLDENTSPLNTWHLHPAQNLGYIRREPVIDRAWGLSPIHRHHD